MRQVFDAESTEHFAHVTVLQLANEIHEIYNAGALYGREKFIVFFAIFKKKELRRDYSSKQGCEKLLVNT